QLLRCLRTHVGRKEAILERVERRGIRLERGPDRAPHLREKLRVGHEKPTLQAGEDRGRIAIAVRHRPPRLAGPGAHEISATRRARASSSRERAACGWPPSSKTT